MEHPLPPSILVLVLCAMRFAPRALASGDNKSRGTSGGEEKVPRPNETRLEAEHSDGETLISTLITWHESGGSPALGSDLVCSQVHVSCVSIRTESVETNISCRRAIRVGWWSPRRGREPREGWLLQGCHCVRIGARRSAEREAGWRSGLCKAAPVRVPMIGR